MIVSYRGSLFAGFQLQNGVRTVQGELEKAIGTILRESIRIHCCGRTDAGVHATGQVVSFKTEKPIPEKSLFLYSVNSLLPRDISVSEYTAVPPDFHPRFSCLAREYEYLIWNDRSKPVHLNGMVLWHKGYIPIQELNEELQEILGEKDFASFTRTEHKDTQTHRYLDTIELKKIHDPYMHSDSLISLRIRGNSFLHNMIRILTGSILDRARKKLSLTIPEIVESRDRLKSGQTAPSDGLYFRHAYYEPMENTQGLLFLENYPRFRK